MIKLYRKLKYKQTYVSATKIVLEKIVNGVVLGVALTPKNEICDYYVYLLRKKIISQLDIDNLSSAWHTLQDDMWKVGKMKNDD